MGGFTSFSKKDLKIIDKFLGFKEDYAHKNWFNLGVGGTEAYTQKQLAPLFLDVILGLKDSSKKFFGKNPFLAVCP